MTYTGSSPLSTTGLVPESATAPSSLSVRKL